MLESFKSLIAIIASLLGIIGGILTVFVVLRRRQLARPSLRLFVGAIGEESGVPKKFRKQLPSIMAIIPRTSLIHPLVTYLILGLENQGKEALRNVRLVLEYKKQYFIDNALLTSILQFEPTVLDSSDDSNVAYSVHSQVREEEFKEVMKWRKSIVHGDVAQISYEIPMIRPGEGVGLYDLLLLKGRGADNFQGLGFGDEGFQNILQLLREIKSIKDYFAISIFVFAENHEKIKSRLSVLRFSDGTDLEEALSKFREAVWLGKLPRSGWYYSDPLGSWIRRKKKRIGRGNRHLLKTELGFVLVPEIAKITSQRSQSFGLAIPELSQVDFFLLNMPNCDYYNLPTDVDSFQAMMKWLGTSSEPLRLPSLKEETKELER